MVMMKTEVENFNLVISISLTYYHHHIYTLHMNLNPYETEIYQQLLYDF